MATYLSMNGTSDLLQTPSMTFTKIVMDFQANPTTGFYKSIFDGRTGSSVLAYVDDSGLYTFGGLSSATLNGGGELYGTTFIKNSRGTITATGSSVTDDITYFSSNFGSDFMQGIIYDIKVYNGATLVAWYDMTTGNVNDQSGNGRNGTLTGGTWVSSGGVAGGGTLTGTGTLTASGRNNISKGAAITGTGSLTATGLNNISGSTSLTGTGTLSASGRNNISGSASLTGNGTLTATGIVAGSLSGSASLQGTGTLTATGTNAISGGASLAGTGTLAMIQLISGSASLTGVGTLTASGVAGVDIIKTVTMYADEEITVTFSASEELTVTFYALEINSVTLDGGP